MTTGVDIDAGPALAGLRAATESLREIAARLAPDQVWTCSSGEVTELLRAQTELAAVVEAAGLALVREADVRGLAGDAGQPSTTTWLSQLLLLTPAEAKARIRDADVVCRKARNLGSALADGQVNPEQARAIASALGKVEAVASAQEYTDAEHVLLTEAKALHAGDLTRLGEHIVAVLDPDGRPERDERAQAERTFTIINLGNGRHRLRGTLTDEGAALVNAAIDVLAAPRPAANGERDSRSAGQRRADALTDLAASHLRYGDLPSTRGARPHIHITVTVETLRGEGGQPFARTASGEDFSPETLRKLCCDAGITPVVVNSLGEPLAAARESRTVTPVIWAALVTRDIGCVFPGCDRPASWSQAHHIRHWCDGGETSLANTALVCDWHHDQIHHHGWQIRLGLDGHPELIPPRWVDPLQQPQRNAHWRLLRDGLRADPDRGP